MKRSLLLCSAVLMALLGSAQVHADDLQLTLDLELGTPNNASGGGNWYLYARVADNGGGVDGSGGIIGISAYLNDSDGTGITFNAAAQPDGAAHFQVLAGGVVEVVYGQDLVGDIVVGVNTPATRDTLIASGTFSGTKPSFAVGADGNFAVGGVGVAPDSVLSSVVTLGDIAGNGTVDLADIQPFIDVLNGVIAYNPAGDIAGTPTGGQNGIVDLADIQPFLNVLNGVPLSSASIAAVPEPASFALMFACGLAVVARRRRGE